MKNKNFILIAGSLIITVFCHSTPTIAGYNEADLENNPVSIVSVKQATAEEREHSEEQATQGVSNFASSQTAPLEQAFRETIVSSNGKFMESKSAGALVFPETSEPIAKRVGRTVTSLYSDVFILIPFFLFFTFFQSVDCQGNGHGHPFNATHWIYWPNGAFEPVWIRNEEIAPFWLRIFRGF